MKLKIICIGLLVFGWVIFAAAQDETPTAVTVQNRTGDLPFSQSIGTGVEHVDIGSGNVIVDVPIISLPGRHMPFNYGLRYNALFWTVIPRTTPTGPVNFWGIERRGYIGGTDKGLGFTPTVPQLSWGVSAETCQGNYSSGGSQDPSNSGQPGSSPSPDTAYTASKYLYTDAGGGKHPLAILQYVASSDSSCFSNLAGASQLQGYVPPEPILARAPDVYSTPAVYMPDGTQVAWPTANSIVNPPVTPDYWYPIPLGQYLDSNGNSKCELEGCNDTLGRIPLTVVNNGGQLLYQFYDSNGAQQTYTVNLASISVASSFNVPSTYGAVLEMPAQSRTVVSSIVLPNQTSFTFQYENGSYGGLTSVTLPTGATISYTWATLLPPGNPWGTHRYIASRTVTVGSQTSTWTFSKTCVDTTCETVNTDVGDPAGNHTLYQHTSGKVLFSQVYNGAVGATLLREYDVAYSVTPYDPSAVPIRITTTLENGLQTKIEYDYDTTGGVPGNVSEIREYDYGLGAPGALLRRTHKTYGLNTNANYLAANIVDKVTQETVYDSTGNTCQGVAGPCAQTQYEYDNYVAGDNPLKATSGAAQHDYTGHGASFTLRGSATRVMHWRNTDGAWLTTTYTYDDLGNVRAIKDPLEHVTSWDYTDSFANSNCLPPVGTSGQAWVSTVTNALGHQINVKRYPCTGLVQAHKDQNDINAGRTGTTYTYDLMGRVLTKTVADGGQASNSYNDVPPVSTTASTKITSALSLVSTTIRDGLGRTTQAQLVSDPAGVDYTDTTYDALGRVATVSNPYRSTSDQTYGITQTQYDALGRPLQVTKQDGSFTTASYSGNCTTATDEAGKPRKSCSDALGRLLEVDEPNPNAPATSATGWVAISGGDQTSGSNVTITVPNAGFETPGVGSGTFGAFQYGPAGGSWTFTGTGVSNNGAGVSGNGSGFTSGNPAAPDGAQVAFLQGDGSTIYQTLSGFQANASYTVSFYAAQRGNLNNGGESFDLYLDSTLLASFSPVGSSYSLLGTPAFTTTAGSHTLKFVGRDPSAWGNTAFIDAVAVTGTATIGDTGTVTITVNGTPYTYNYGAGDTAATVAAALTNTINGGSLVKAVATTNADVTVPNAGFETPGVGSGTFGAFQYSPAGGGWSFSGAGIAGNGSGFTSGNPAAPDGGQVAFLQNAGSTISQTFSGFQAGTSYTVSFYAAQRGNCCGSGGQDFDVYLDGTRLGTFHPAGTGYSLFSTPAFTTTTGSHTLLFVGRDSAGGDNTAFIDAVRVSAAGGNVISLTSVAAGSSSNYLLATSSTHSGNFTQSSFTASASGATLTGGLDPGSISTSPYVTLYQYDALGNLLRVDQKGSAPNDSTKWRTRTFAYNSLSQLLTAANPETGTIIYSYDADGNVSQKTSPQANQLTAGASTYITYCYDAVHRLVAKGYALSPNPAQQCSPTPPYLPNAAAVYTYDQGPEGIGHITSLTDQAGTGAYSYDAMGRIANEQRTLNGVQKTMSYDYNLDGSVKILHYPSGAAVTYTPDSAGHVLSAIDAGNNINYATSATYSPAGALTGFVSGQSNTFTGITNGFVYNNRLQPCRTTASSTGQLPTTCTNLWGNLLDLEYRYNLGAGDNGNVTQIVNWRDQSRNQIFAYDALNRLTSAQNAGTDCTKTTVNGKTEYWGNSYGYDAWGNLLSKTVTKCSAENLTVAVLSNNQLVSYGYDAAGNMTALPNSPTMGVYDQENRLSSVTVSGATTSYVYDADGNRVAKSNGTAPTLYWYMAPGIVAESDLTGTLKSEYIFFDGERVARRDGVNGAGGVFYYFSDHLKTTDIVTDASGKILNESDFYPWGGELQFLANDSNHYKFTGKERDSETQLDYFGARYYSNGLGRFITPDWAAKATAVPYAEFSDPQSLNLYSYVRNIPTTRLDQDGHCGMGDVARVGFGDCPLSQALHNLGQDTIGLTKGYGSVIYHTLMSTTPPTQLIDHYKGEPSFLQATNDLQKAGKISGQISGTALTLGLPGPKGAGAVTSISAETRVAEGSFSVLDWGGYSSLKVSQPTGPFRMLEGPEYENARQAANIANRAMHAADPSLDGMHIHEIHPVKFGGSPTDPANKMPLTPSDHIEVTKWWNQLLRDLQPKTK